MEYNTSDFVGYVITGTDANGRRFRITCSSYRYASGHNVYNGTLWGVLKATGKRVRLHRWYN